jgi:uncharacterized membrane protein
MHYLHHSGDTMMTGGWFVMALGMIIVLAVLTTLVLWLLQQRRGGEVSVPVHGGMCARQALDHQLVAGELTPSQYDELRAQLDGPPGVVGSPPDASPSG